MADTALYKKVTRELHRYKVQAFDTPKYLILDEDSYFQMKDDNTNEKPYFIPDFAQQAPNTGDTYLGLKVAVLTGVRTETIKIT